MKTIRNALGALAAAVVLGGCATVSDIPIEEMTQSRATIRAAEEVGAENVPSAATHLQLARDQTERANALLREGEERRAAFVLERAAADAELAIALAREVPLRAETERALERVRQLQAQ
jgi:hypothetical protein